MKQAEKRRIQIELCCGVIGALLLLGIGRMVGDEGCAYLGIALNTFALLWAMTGSYTADVLGRMIRSRCARGQYRSASRCKSVIFRMQAGIGLLGCVLMVLFATFGAERIFGNPYSRPLMLILAPVLLVRSISSALLGWLKGDGTEMPTVIVCEMRYLLTVVFAVLFGWMLGNYGAKVSALLEAGQFTAMYGGMGAMIGILLAEVLGLVFLVVVCMASRRSVKRERTDAQRVYEGAAAQVGMFWGAAWPQMVRNGLVGLAFWMGMVLAAIGLSQGSDFYENYGLLFGKYLPLCAVVVLPLAALLTEDIAAASQGFRREERRSAQRYFLGGLHGAFVQGVFFAVFMAVTAAQLAEWVCTSGGDETVEMLRVGAFAIPLALLGYYLTKQLFDTAAQNLVLLGLFLADLLYAIAALAVIRAGGGVMALVYAALISGAVYCVGMEFLAVHQFGCRIDWVQVVVIPTVCACVLGLVVLLIANALSPHLGCAVTILLLLVLSYALYWAALLLMRNITEQDLAYFPGGALLGKIGGMLNLLR